MKRRPPYFEILVAIVVCCAVGLAAWNAPPLKYARQRQAAEEAVVQLVSRRPPEVDPAVWDVATTWAMIAYANVCFSDQHVSLEELRRFQADVERRQSESVALSTIDWLWERLEATGPHGRKYRNRFEPSYRREITAAAARRKKP